MSSTYTPDPTATQAPAPQPAPDNFPLETLPSAGDGATAASVAQAFKVLGDAIAWLKTPRAKLNDLAKEILSFRNARLIRRGGFDHQGYPAGLWVGFDEDWCDNGFTAKTTSSTGLWGKGWQWEYGVTGGTLAGGGISIQDQTVGGGGVITGPLCPLLQTNPFPNAAATAWNLVEMARAKAVTSSDTASFIEWSGNPGGTGWSVGIAGGSQVGLSAENNAMLGFAAFKRTADTHIQLYTNDGTTQTFTDTGIASATRFKLEYQAINQADGGSAIASLSLDGGTPTTKVVNLGSFIGRPYVRAWSATFVTAPSTMGGVRFRTNLFPGDHFI